MKKKLMILLLLVLSVLVVFFVFLRPDDDTETTNSSANPDNKSQNIETAFDKSKYSIDDPTSIWVVVNKERPLPANYTPAGLTYIGGAQLRAEARDALDKLINDAKINGTPLSALSTYRSYEYQKNLYDSYVKKDGVENADRYSARPGHSEHQTGLAVDLGNGNCDLKECFGETTAGKWLAANAHKYGFIIRYEKDRESLTGYQYEPWHLRYIGVELAGELSKSGQTLEQFFGLEPATSY